MRRWHIGWLFVAIWLFVFVSRVFRWPVAAGWFVPPPLVLVAILFAVAAIATRRVAAPMGDLVGAAERVARRDYAARVPERGAQSVRAVARAFNEMTTRLEAQDRARRDLMADIAHELRTPLTIIQGRLEGILDGVYARDDRQLEGLLDDTRVLARLVEDLRTLAHADNGTLTLYKEPVDLGTLLREAADACRPQADAAQIAVVVEGVRVPITMDADPVRLREVLTNLITNAIRHTPAGGHITVSGEQRGDRSIIRVADTGEGIPAEDLPRLFDRFYKGRTSTGSGLGLAIARGIVTAHHGSITADNRPGAGALFTISVPSA
jgi:two-component system sensor histidine kinase BaeS